MSVVQEQLLPAEHQESFRSSGFVQAYLRDPLGVVALVVVILVVLATVLAPLIAPYSPTAVDFGHQFASPSGAHLLGTDNAGRDVLSELLYGGRQTLLGAVIVLAVALLLGAVPGLVAGFFRGWFDVVAGGIAVVLMALPGIIVLLGVRAVAGPSTTLLVVTLGVLVSPNFFRLVRTTVLGVRNELYVEAARVFGLSDVRIIARHILFAVRAPILVQGALVAALSVGVQAALSYLGIGSGSSGTWGGMLGSAFQVTYQDSMLILWPALAIALMSGGLVLVGNSVRDAFEVNKPASARRARHALRRAAKAAPPAAPPTTAGPLVTPGTALDPDALLQIQDLHIAYPVPDGVKQVVSGASLTVRPGETVGLVGESGSGKTQTAFAVLRLLPRNAAVTSGQVFFEGVDLRALPPKRAREYLGREIAYVPQEPMTNLDPNFTIGQQLTEPIRLTLKLGRAQARRRALELLDEVGIADPAATFASYPHQISGGMAQRALIAGAVSCNPKLLIADEPTTALDVTVQAEVLDLLRRLTQSHHMATLFITHDLGVVADICDRVAVMRSGTIVESASAADLFARPAHSYTQELLKATVERLVLRGPYVQPEGAGA